PNLRVGNEGDGQSQDVASATGGRSLEREEPFGREGKARVFRSCRLHRQDRKNGLKCVASSAACTAQALTHARYLLPLEEFYHAKCFRLPVSWRVGVLHHLLEI